MSADGGNLAAEKMEEDPELQMDLATLTRAAAAGTAPGAQQRTGATAAEAAAGPGPQSAVKKLQRGRPRAKQEGLQEVQKFPDEAKALGLHAPTAHGGKGRKGLADRAARRQPAPTLPPAQPVPSPRMTRVRLWSCYDNDMLVCLDSKGTHP